MLFFQEIDEYIAKARDQGYNTVLQLGTKGLSYATAVVMQTALKVFIILIIVVFSIK